MVVSGKGGIKNAIHFSLSLSSFLFWITETSFFDVLFYTRRLFDSIIFPCYKHSDLSRTQIWSTSTVIFLEHRFGHDPPEGPVLGT